MDDYKLFHKFVFRYHLLKPGQKTLDLESAVVLLNIVVHNIYPPLADKFVKFMRATDKKVMTQDQWNGIVDVFPLLDKPGEYDPSGCCMFP